MDYLYQLVSSEESKVIFFVCFFFGGGGGGGAHSVLSLIGKISEHRKNLKNRYANKTCIPY